MNGPSTQQVGAALHTMCIETHTTPDVRRVTAQWLDKCTYVADTLALIYQ